MPASSSGSEATPPSAPTSAADRPPRRGRFALALAGAAAAACWNPLGAPFALVAGAGAAALALRGLARGPAREDRRRAAATLALGAGAALASVLVLLAAAGLGVRPEEKLGVEPRSAAEAARALDDAASSSREARERAAQELERLPGERGEGAREKRAGDR